MDIKIVRLHSAVKVIGAVGIITALIVTAVSVITGELGFIAVALIFAVLGGMLFLAYKRQYIVFTEEEIIAAYILRKKVHISYEDIGCIILADMANRTCFNIADKNYRCLLAVDSMMNAGFLEAFFESPAADKDIIDIGKFIEEGKDVNPYINALTRAQISYYRKIAGIDDAIDEFYDLNTDTDIEKSRKLLKVIGWILIGADVLAFIIGGIPMMIIYITAALVPYCIYVKYYPYVFFETVSKKAEEKLLRIPFCGALIALIILLMISGMYNYDFSDILIFTAIIAAILLTPFVIKSVKLGQKQRLARKLSVAAAVLFISFSIAFPVNFVLTFDVEGHDEIVITDKTHNSGKNEDWYVWAEWKGEKSQFTVTESEYEQIRINDDMRVCIRKSVFGFEYWTVHK